MFRTYHPGKQVVIYYLPYEEGNEKKSANAEKPAEIALAAAAVQKPESMSILKPPATPIAKKSAMQITSKSAKSIVKSKESAFGWLRRPTNSLRIKHHALKLVRIVLKLS